MTTPAGPPSPSLAGPAEVLRRLELAVTRRLDGLLHGDHRGLVPGHGSEPGEARPYQPGDDVRRIDWNVTARLQVPHVRDTVADRELETWLLADLSASLDFGTARCQKRDLVLAAAAAAGFLTQRGGNRLGAVLVGAGAPVTIPARNGRDHLRGVLHRIAAFPSAERQGAVDLEGALRRLDRGMRRRGLAVVLSDWLGPDAWTSGLRALAVRHDVLCVEVVDPRELELPDVGLLDVVDPESGRRRTVDTGSAALRNRYAAAASARRDELARTFRAAGADHLVLRTDRDWLADLVAFVVSRPARIAALRRPS